MKIRPIPSVGTDNDTDFEGVVLVMAQGKIYPYCKKHGAMHKVSEFSDKKGGYWRCSVTSETRCRSGCISE